MERSRSEDVSSSDEPDPKRHKRDNLGPATRKRESNLKNVLVLTGRDVLKRDGKVYVTNTIEMAQLKKPERGQFKTKIKLPKTMTGKDVEAELRDQFPVLRKDGRFYCGTLVENRTRVEFHDNPPTVWDGTKINRRIRGNSALYVYFEETPESVFERPEPQTVDILQQQPQTRTPEPMGSSPPYYSEKLKSLKRKHDPSSSLVPEVVSSTGASVKKRVLEGTCHEGNKEGEQQSPLEQPEYHRSNSTASLLCKSGTFQKTQNQQTGDFSQKESAGEDHSKEPQVVTEDSAYETAAGNASDVDDKTKHSIGEIGLAPSGVVERIEDYLQNSKVDPSEGSSLEDIDLIRIPPHHQIDLSEGELNEIYQDVLGITLFEPVITKLCPKEGPITGGTEFVICLNVKGIPENVTSLRARFDGVGFAGLTLVTEGVYTGNSPASETLGKVAVTVGSLDDTWNSPDETEFEYHPNVTQELQKLLSKMPDTKRNIPLDDQTFHPSRSARTVCSPSSFSSYAGDGSSLADESQDISSLKALQCILFEAAATNDRKCVETIFSTSAGEAVFQTYRNSSILPEDIARARGHQNLAEYLQNVHKRLSEEIDCNVQTVTIDWVELKRATAKKNFFSGADELQPMGDLEHVSFLESDDDQSSYFADDEMSVCQSPSTSEFSNEDQHMESKYTDDAEMLEHLRNDDDHGDQFDELKLSSALDKVTDSVNQVESPNDSEVNFTQELAISTPDPQDHQAKGMKLQEKEETVVKGANIEENDKGEKEREGQVLEEQPQTEVSPFCILPSVPTHDVASRPFEVAEMTKQLGWLKGANSDNLSILCISGSPGCGKSQLAGLVAKRFFDESKETPSVTSFVMTLSAESSQTLFESYISFAQNCKCPEYAVTNIYNSKHLSINDKISSFKTLISERIELYTSWLLVIGNVTSLSHLHTFLPDPGNQRWMRGQMLITTRDTKFIPLISSSILNISIGEGILPDNASSLLKLLSGVTDDKVLDFVYDEQGELNRAKECYELALDIRPKTFGLDHVDAAWSCNNLGLVYNTIGDLNRTNDSHHLALKIRLKTLGPHHVHVAATYDDLGWVHHQLGNQVEAKDFHDRALQIRLKKFGPVLFDVAWSHNTLGFVNDELGDLNRTKDCYKRALEICLKTLGPDHVHVATTYDELGRVNSQLGDLKPGDIVWCYHNPGYVHVKLGDLNQAKDCHNRALEIRLKKLEPNHFDVAWSYNILFFVYDEKGDLNRAKDCHHRALEIRLKTYRPDHGHIAWSYHNLGFVYVKLGDPNRAKACHDHILEIRLQTLGPDHVHVATTYENLRCVHYQLGDLNQAKDFHDCVLKIRLKKLGPDHFGVAWSYNTLGFVNDELGDLNPAKDFYERALAIRRKELGPGHVAVAMAYHNLGLVHSQLIVHYQLGDLDQAKDCYERCLVIRLKELGQGHVDVAMSSHNLGLVHSQLGDQDQAKDFYEQGLVIRLEELGPEHIDVAMSYHNLGLVLSRLGDLNQAKDCCEHGLDIRLKELGPEHVDAATWALHTVSWET